MLEKLGLYKKNWKSEKKRSSEKLKRFVYKDSGTEEAGTFSEMHSVPCLGEKEAVKIAGYANAIESHYGVPRDIEWAVDLDLSFPKNTFMLQARPVTAVAEKKAPSSNS